MSDAEVLRPIGSQEPVTIRVRPGPKRVLPSGPYTVETEFDGRLSVCDGDVNVLATFDPDYADLAEEMRARLTIRQLARVADFMRCPTCGHPANAIRRALSGGPAVFTHEDGTEHLDLRAERP